MALSDDQNSDAVQPHNAETGKDARSLHLFGRLRGSWRGPSLSLSPAQLKTFFAARTSSRSKSVQVTTTKKDDWHEWSRFKLWRRTRPFAGSILIMLAGLLVLWGPVELLPFALLPGSNIWAGLLVGGLLFIMGLIQLLVPANSLVTGAIAVILSLVSLIVAAGGLGLGMLLGIIGGAMGIAWQPVSRTRKRGPQGRQTRPTKPLFILPAWLKNPFLRSESQ